MPHDVGEWAELLQQVAAVGVGGFVGSVGRYLVGLVMRAWLPGLPAGTLVANLAAGLIIGLVTGMDLASPLPANLRLLLAVGICGGLSTFSTFSSETVQLAEAGSWGGVALNVALNVGLCCLAVVVGLRLSKFLVA
ncbi:MAG: fluoride efflux transporter CrcB [Atopobiaceae bacterium]|jgi:CrcB protein|nr:fluoride efflux transporter CrcB [Atopobiaceae bacterium]MCH4179848.1 fluoride efflux transporter CrcB [Atopobiaceae bacterium]MCH4213599.1 fluoride efflux transporter CrcB [Atopobiaceae bacterium]MCH4229604.1 fluoride efflux transporter CrcB [Atopobiaceae bacterium]MCH4276247.1 fluoride efflux transporter CrcB [Atopobiaceae bacterium]